jgi:hypothetical protein
VARIGLAGAETGRAGLGREQATMPREFRLHCRGRGSGSSEVGADAWRDRATLLDTPGVS